MLNGSAAVYAAVYAEDGQILIDKYGAYSASMTAEDKIRLKSIAVGKVEASLLDALKGCPDNADDLRSAADMIFKAIMRDDGGKSAGFCFLGEGMLGAMKRCCMNNRPETVLEELRENAEWIVGEIEKNDAPASLGLGTIGSALQDAGGETLKIEELSEDIAPVVNMFSEASVAKSPEKSVGMGTLGQGMIGAMKRCYINNKEIPDDMRETAAWIAGWIVRNRAAAATGLGKIGAALMDSIGETGKEYRSYVTPVVNAFASDGGTKGEGLAILGQGMVGAMKRCYINNKPIPNDLQDVAEWIVDEIGDNDSEAAVSLGKIGAALMDGIGETGRDFRTYLEPVVEAFSTAGAAKAEGLGIMGQGMVGALKRCYINNKPIPDDMQEVAEWIADEIGNDNAGAAAGLGRIGAALMDGIGETGEEYRLYVTPVVNAFASDGGKKGEGLGILGQGMVGAIKRCHINNKPIPDEMVEAAEWITGEIGNDSAGAAAGLGQIGAALMDGIAETGGDYMSYMQPAVEAMAPGDSSKAEGLAILCNAIAGVTKRCYMDDNTHTVPDGIQEAETRILGWIESKEPGKSRALGIMGSGLLASIQRNPALSEDFNDAADMIVNEIEANPAGKSEGLARTGEQMLNLIIRVDQIQSQQADPDDLYGQSDSDLKDVLYEVTDKVVEAIEDNSADKSWIAGPETDSEENWGVGSVGQELMRAVVEHSQYADDLYAAGNLIFEAFDDNPASKSKGITQIGKALTSRISEHPGLADELCDAADTLFDAIRKNAPGKSMGIAITGESLLGVMAGKPELADDFLSTATASIRSIQMITEKEQEKDDPSRTSGGGDKGLPGVNQQKNSIVTRSLTDGSITVSPDSAAEGEPVTLTAVPDVGYRLADLKVKSAGSGETIELTDKGDGVYSFLMPGNAVTFEASFELLVKPEGNEWYSEGVAYVLSRGIMQGTDRGFEPGATASRVQIAQLLMNLDGTKPKGSTAVFSDVSPDDWYAEAVTWMVENGIAKGQGSSFGAGDFISREDLAVMLRNYAGYKGYDITVRGSLESFPDVESVSGYAREALEWAVGAGLIDGTTDASGNTVIDPRGNATRAQIAVIIERFCKTVAK
ncbi:MAG: S-layer homology domain-containing protein [Clostridia bacterium]|nr:S-layer homology domain-containing protein [Clostridia bacterium]